QVRGQQQPLLLRPRLDQRVPQPGQCH
ncbi:hypothetical protein BN1723_019659, partial [Verticillium longisporum]